ELAFTYQPSAEWQKMLELYREAESAAELTASAADAPVLKCVALRGQGYALVELQRLDEATRLSGVLETDAGRTQVIGRAWIYGGAAENVALNGHVAITDTWRFTWQPVGQAMVPCRTRSMQPSMTGSSARASNCAKVRG